jgi:shikimate dehydrogenase
VKEGKMPEREAGEDKKLCGIIGTPLSHTLSPAMHNAAFKELALDFVYEKFDVAEDDLAETFESLKERGFRGLNVTIPYKIRIMDFLDFLSDEASELGAVNTIINDSGYLRGYNTDIFGAVEAIKANGIVLEKFNEKVIIIGAGGGARAAAFGLAKLGLDIIITSRTDQRARDLSEELNKTGNVEAVKFSNAVQELSEAGMIINCTPVGMKGGPPGSPVSADAINGDLVLFDMVYSPKVTPFLQAGLDAGAKIIYGYEMFIYQGAKSFELWTDMSAPLDVMRKVVIDGLQ